VLYETLTLTRLFKRESDLATLKAVVSAEIPPPSSLRPEVPQELDAIILKALERDVSRRYQTAAELADALSAFLVGRQYVRSERVLADFMAGLFDADRRLGKLRVAQATASEGPDGTRKTPSLLKHLPQHLSPIRNTSSLPEVPVPISAAPPPAADVELPATTAKPTLARRQRRTRLLIAGGAGVSLLVTIALAAALKPREPEQPTRPPEVPRPVVEVTPPPTTPQSEKAPEKPSSEGDPKPTDPPSDPKVAKPKAATAKGKLTLDTTPWSEVFLKGRKLGDTPLVDYPLPAGVHVLTLVNDGKGLRSVIEVEIQPGNKTTVKKLKL
jgi:serine/threonine-protein kinase